MRRCTVQSGGSLIIPLLLVVISELEVDILVKESNVRSSDELSFGLR